MMSTGELGAQFGGTRCQDCGNQAKKNCVYMRCRTCCKRRGFECETHIKSTWIPAYRRRQRYHHHHHRHQQLLPVHHEQELQVQKPKRLRENPSSSAGLQMGNFPAEVTSEVTFRCVKVSSTDNEIDQTLAYQTAISVGGHIFKGFLYYHGPESCSNFGESSSSELRLPPPPPPPQPSYPFNIGTLITGTNATASASVETPYPSSYSLPFGSYTPAGTQFFPQYPRS